ncbi:hypothetical protein [Streptomyces sp. S465]|uniref:hypothetical protein n=1 Tax=Streptomyces sp. S465 TaxID=2979468 RepID=UPI0022A8ADD5|nr:hypothetical protein [Streptomyces sp. S465]WAP57810.1 hypothetical protein N6H00_24190 [Streptomyces sp. S465]
MSSTAQSPQPRSDYGSDHDPPDRTSPRPSGFTGALGVGSLLERNILTSCPGLSERGSLATTAHAGGIPYSELVHRLVRAAFTKPAYVP